MKTESSSLRHITSKKKKTHALLATVSPHLSCFNGPGFIKAPVVKHPPFLKKNIHTLLVSFPYPVVKIMIQKSGITMWLFFFLINNSSSGKNNETWDAVYLYVKVKAKFSIG